MDSKSLQPLTSSVMSSKLQEWMPKMKSAMFFLNNVSAIKYMEIEPSSSTLKTICHFQSSIPNNSKFQHEIDDLKGFISKFREVTNCQTSRALYPLTITELSSEKETESEEKWLVQQGIGNLKDRDKFWQYVKVVKPRHGIAAPRVPQDGGQ